MRDYLKDFEDGILAILVKKSDFGEFLAFMEDKCGYDFDNARKGYLDNFTGIYKECVDVFAYIPKYSKTHRIIFSHTCSREQISWTELKKLLEDDPFNLATYTYLDQHHGMPSGHYLDFKDQSCADGMSVEALNYNARWFAGVYKTSDDARVACNTFKTINWTTLGTDLINKIVNSVLGMFSDIPNALRSIGHSAWDAFVNIDWFSVGSNVIGGIANGIWNGAGRIIEAAKSAASDALEAAKKKLDIQSPSKVFRKEVGLMISEGIALGIEDGEGSVTKAIDSMNSDMMFRFGDGFDYSPSIEAVSGVAPVNGDKNVYITNNITVDGAKDPEVYVGQLVRDLKLQMRAL